MSPPTELQVLTRAAVQMVDVTERVREVLRTSGVRDGLCVVHSPHTTAGVTVQENADPDVQRDLLLALAHAVPDQLPGAGYRHAEGNSPAHVKTSLVGTAATVIVSGGELVLGTWQGLYLCEFDGPRTRKLVVKLIAG